MCPVAIVTNFWILVLEDSWPHREPLCNILQIDWNAQGYFVYGSHPGEAQHRLHVHLLPLQHLRLPLLPRPPSWPGPGQGRPGRPEAVQPTVLAGRRRQPRPLLLHIPNCADNQGNFSFSDSDWKGVSVEWIWGGGEAPGELWRNSGSCFCQSCPQLFRSCSCHLFCLQSQNFPGPVLSFGKDVLYRSLPEECDHVEENSPLVFSLVHDHKHWHCL